MTPIPDPFGWDRVGDSARVTIDMSAVTTPCSRCQSTLGGTDDCLICLLRAGLDPERGEDRGDPTVIGDFRIVCREDGSLCELGRGAMGVTYRAMDNVLHRAVALKVITTPGLLAASSPVRERFLREARGAAALRHPNVAEVFQFGTSPETGRAYYAMELIEGETLEASVRRNGPLETLAALHVGVQVAQALTAAAANHLVHRDLKPGNIMLSSRSNQVTVIDFGLAKTVAGAADPMNLTHAGFVGTPMFASPEQFRGEPADARSDIYSLGVTLWYALTGEVPFSGRSIDELRRAQCETALPLWQLRARKLPGCVIAMLARTLAMDPAGRPQSAAAMLASLEQCQAAVARTGKRRRLQRTLLLVACASCGLAALAGWWTIRGGGGRLWERNATASKPGRSAPAYQEYLRGLALLTHDAGGQTPLRQAEDAFNAAVRIDPSFAQAWARLSIVHSNLFWDFQRGSASRLALARQTLETAEKLAPNLGEVFLARGYYHYHGQLRYDEAIHDFTQASQRLPNSADALYALGLVQRRQGRWDEALTSLTQAARLDPTNPAYMAALYTTNRSLGKYQDALAITDRQLAIAPGEPKAIIFKADIYHVEGDLPAATRLLEPMKLEDIGTSARNVQIDHWFYERRYQRVIEACLEALASDSLRNIRERVDVLLDLGFARKWSGDTAGMNATFHEARELLILEQPATIDNADDSMRLAQIDAGLGDRDTALREGERSLALSPDDAVAVAVNEVTFARVCAQLGDAPLATAALHRLLRTLGSEISSGLLRLDPVWDPIRREADFAKLAEGSQTDGRSP